MTQNQEHFTLSANRLHDGIVVYITKNLSWSENPQDALLLPSQNDAQNLLNSSIPHHIIAPYIISINPSNLSPSLFREQIRTLGPSVRKDLGRQALPHNPKP